MSNPQIQMPGFCLRHSSLLLRQAEYKESDPWRALLIAAEITLFQAMTCDKKVQEKLDGVIEDITKLGCFACYKPEVFGQIVRAVRSSRKGDISKVVDLGKRMVLNSQASEGKICPFCEKTDPAPECLGAIPDGRNLNKQWRCLSCGKEWEGE